MNGAAIASERAAQIYNMTILAKEIEDIKNNSTRFFVLDKKDSSYSGEDKTSILFSIKDRVGALYNMLFPFRKYGINLTKIESRPTKKKAWEYVFFVDFEGHIKDNNVSDALEALQDYTIYLKHLGSYPRA